MTTYRPLRIAPDLPNSHEIDEDTPPASPYQNRLPPKARPAIRVGKFFTITLPQPRTFIAIGLVLLSIGWLFTPRQYKPRLVHPKHEPTLKYKNVDWRKYAYTMYAADIHRVCSALMVFDQLDKYGSKADRVLFYPQDWDSHHEHAPDFVDKLFTWAREIYKVKLRPVHIHGIKMIEQSDLVTGKHRYDIPDGGKLDPSITKFLAVSQEQYLRVIHLESHISLLKHLDELFLAPPAQMALTRRYLTHPTNLAAHMFMVSPRKEDAESLFELAKGSIWSNDYYDSQILTEQYAEQAMVLSHRQYGLNAAEFRREDHYYFLGNEWEEWNPERALREASLILFDEEPIPKPWINLPQGMPDSWLPHCSFDANSDQDISCRNRKIWTSIYNDYKRRRKDVCRMPPVMASVWQGPSPNEHKSKGEEKEGASRP